MWPLLLRLGVIATLGVGLGLVVLLTSQQSEVPHPSIPADRVRKRKKNEGSQRQSLTDQLNNGTASCVICKELITSSEKVWSCSYCRNIFHLVCISRWATSVVRSVSRSWKCPCCRKDIDPNKNPLTYTCMCGRVRNPPSKSGVTPHCCGKRCLKDCGELCHPGSCWAV